MNFKCRSTVSSFFLLRSRCKFLSNSSLVYPLFREIMGTEEMWPYLLAVSGIPAILQFVTLLFFPEAPRYLYIDKGDTEGSVRGEWTMGGNPEGKVSKALFPN